MNFFNFGQNRTIEIDVITALEGTPFPTYKYRSLMDDNGNIIFPDENGLKEYIGDIKNRLTDIEKELYELKRDHNIQSNQLTAQSQRGGCVWIFFSIFDSIGLANRYSKRKNELNRQKMILQTLYESNIRNL